MLSGAHALIRSSGRSLLNLVAQFPARHHVVVHGWPDGEGNSLSAAAQLAESLDAPVYLLCEDCATTERRLSQLSTRTPGASRVITVAKQSLKAFRLAASARFVLFTHGLFGNPAPGRHRVYVNLWHGHGPKRTANAAYEARIPSDALVTNTAAWGRVTAASLGLDAAALANIGNPRQDALLDPPSSESLARLGLSKDRPYVVWMPTFRRVSSQLAHNWTDADALTASASDQALGELRTAIEASGVDFRVKLHPMDADRLGAFSRWRVSDADLNEAGTSLYAFLGGSAGLISDYSSVWVEYLTLDRNLLLFCPDAEEYKRGRGFKRPSMFDLASDLIVTRGAGVEEFLAAVAKGQEWRRPARLKATEALELPPPGPCSPRLVTLLADTAARKGLAVRVRPGAAG